MIVYVGGKGGLGNCLFQIATAIYYVERYKYKIILDKNSKNMTYGTSNKFNRKQGKKKNNMDITYDQTIYKKLYFRK